MASNLNHLLSARRPSNFLVLAPTASANYPTSPKALAPAAPASKEPVSPTEDLGSPVVKPTDNVAPEIAATPRDHRSDSVSSTGSARFKFLKLGPVHFGKGDSETDFADAE
ncbi:uncharacterized protein BKCO1_230001 [Diplodia corticola]|uniref:Uncharacterized protein n=1 Tax=Diplodia corticola TaxID=236234 RepID=A0A1J9R1H9_9PEZI|nr:uncharacterized protein BKCO1_230001 [Diplodia corticola]OJD34472.1 hypothetical protein BKCO1_230001 [Diplodia corticola]